MGLSLREKQSISEKKGEERCKREKGLVRLALS